MDRRTCLKLGLFWCSLWLTLISTWLIHRSGTTILCSDQRRYNSVQTNHSWRGRVLELSGCAWCTRCAVDLACLLSEKAAAETRIEHCKHLSTSSAGWSRHPLALPQEHAAVTQVALPRSHTLPVGEPDHLHNMHSLTTECMQWCVVPDV